jgi:branched-chain amino acid transport system ATP-binding protein
MIAMNPENAPATAPHPTRAPLLACQSLEVFYGKYLQVLRGVSLDVKPGEVVALLGPNGAGKTTLIRTLMGLIPGQPERGQVLFQGEVINRWDTGRRVQAGLACVPEGREVFPELSVTENLIMGAWRRGTKTTSEDMDRVFSRFPILKERSRQLAGTLSGGEQQMLAIGRALMSRPKMLLLDEPSLGLAPKVVDSIFQILRELAREDIALLLVEQNARLALSFAERADILEGGRIVLNGPAKELADNPDVREFYLGIKQSASLKGYRRYKRRRRWA